MHGTWQPTNSPQDHRGQQAAGQVVGGQEGANPLQQRGLGRLAAGRCRYSWRGGGGGSDGQAAGGRPGPASAMPWHPTVRCVRARPAGGLERGTRRCPRGGGRSRPQRQHRGLWQRSRKCAATDRTGALALPVSELARRCGQPAHAGNGCWRAPLPPAQSLTSVRPLGTACVEAAAAQHHGPRRLHRYPRLHGPRQAGDPLPPHCGRPGAPGLPRATGAAAAAASATARSGFGTLIVGQQRIFNTSR